MALGISMHAMMESRAVNGIVKAALKKPFSKKRLMSIIEKASDKQLAALLLGMSYADFFRVHRGLLEYPAEVQEKVLQEMLKAAANTEFGQAHQLGTIASIDEFREKVPLSTWDDYAAYAKRMEKGEADLLFPGKATYFFRTSGTTSSFKFIPEGEREEVARKTIDKIRYAEFMLATSLGAMDKFFAFFNRIGLDVTEGGIPKGTASGRSAQQSARESLKRFAYAPLMVDEMEGDALHYTIMRCTLASDDVTAIRGNNAQMMTTLIRFAQEHALEIIEDIRKGTNRYPMSDALKEQEKKALTPNPARADELLALLKEDKLIPRYYWPHLVAAAFWLGGSVGVNVAEIRELLPENTTYFDVGYGASEAKMNIPMAANTPAGALSLFSAFYEFIPEDGGEPLLAHELEDGKNYEIVITTYTGLFRYRLNDLVHVEGFTGKTPNIYFVTKTTEVANLAQEKITGVMLIEAISRIAERSGYGIKTAQVYPDPETMSYIVCIETRKQPEDSEAFRSQMDEGLREELGYYEKYRRSVLAPCSLVLMGEGWSESLIKEYSKGNVTAAQVKVPVVIGGMPREEWIQEIVRAPL